VATQQKSIVLSLLGYIDLNQPKGYCAYCAPTTTKLLSKDERRVGYPRGLLRTHRVTTALLFRGF
jgi:hypothetical protein